MTIALLVAIVIVYSPIFWSMSKEEVIDFRKGLSK